MQLLDGKKVSQAILEQLQKEVSTMQTKPGLAVVLVGNNPASLAYIKKKEEAARFIGIHFSLHHLGEQTQQQELLSLIQQLNQNQDISGIIVQLPLPKHLRESAVIEMIDVRKDVDGFHPLNLGRLLLGEECLASSTSAGIITLLQYYKIPLDGKKVTIIGRSNIIGKPLSVFLMNLGATVTVCHSKTSDLASYTSTADMVIVGVGHPKLVTADMVRDGVIVIDAGWNRVGQRVVGDVDFEAVAKKASWITPVPGGVGPMTVASLMVNTVKAHRALSKNL